MSQLPPPERLLSWTQVRPLVGDIGYTTWWRLMGAGDAPKPVRVARNRVAWREGDIAAWQAACASVKGV